MPRGYYKNTGLPIGRGKHPNLGESNPAKRPDVRKKISLAKKGKTNGPLSESHKKNISASMIGKFGKESRGYKHGKSAKYYALLRSSLPRSEHCDVCLMPANELKRKLCFDHDHSTNKFRGWLCTTCNTALGCARDNPTILRALANYLEKNKNN